MKLTNSEEDFLKAHKETLSKIFRARIEELKEDMVLEEKPEEREKIRELVIEFKRWITDIGIITNEKEPIKDTGI